LAHDDICIQTEGFFPFLYQTPSEAAPEKFFGEASEGAVPPSSGSEAHTHEVCAVSLQNSAPEILLPSAERGAQKLYHDQTGVFEGEFLLDSGATTWCLKDKYFARAAVASSQIRTANGELVKTETCVLRDLYPAAAGGRALVNVKAEFSKNFRYNIASLSSLLDMGAQVNANFSRLILGKNCYIPISRRGGLFYIRLRILRNPKHFKKTKNTGEVNATALEHARSGHVLPLSGGQFCGPCAINKIRKGAHRRGLLAKYASERFLQSVSCDLVGPFKQQGVGGERYLCVFVDQFSRFCFCRAIKRKSDAVDALRFFCAHVGVPETLRSDNGGEFEGRFTTYCVQNRIARRKTAPYSPASNGLCEVYNREIVKGIKVLLDGATGADVCESWWPYAAEHFCHLLNRKKKVQLQGATSFELAFGYRSAMVHRVWGCDCVFRRNDRELNHKLARKGRLGTYIGQCHESPSHLVAVRENGKFRRIRTRSVSRFLENGKLREDTTLLDIPETPLRGILKKESAVSGGNTEKRVRFAEQEATHWRVHCEHPTPPRPKPYRKSHARAQVSFVSECEVEDEARTWCGGATECLSTFMHFCCLTTKATKTDRESEPEAWNATDKAELDGLEERGVYSWVPESEARGSQILNSCMIRVFKEGAERRKKSRCIVLGNQQRQVDGETVYSAVPKLSNIRLLLHQAAARRWSLQTYDIKQAFLYAPLKESVFCRPPSGSARAGKVWRLNKALYGLRLSPRAWSDFLQEKLASTGEWQTSENDPNIFIHKTRQVALCVYVDDLLFLGRPQDIPAAKDSLAQFFELSGGGKNFCDFEFLGLKFRQNAREIRVGQRALCDKILTLYGQGDATPAKRTPITKGEIQRWEASQTVFKGTLVKRDQYRAFVGAVNYLCANTRPDLAFPVSYLSKNLAEPSELDLAVATRVLQYISYSKDRELVFSKRQGVHPFRMHAYSDAAWLTGQSQAGGLIYVGKSLVFWRSTRIKSICLSSCEAEFVSASELGRELVYVQRVNSELNAKIASAPGSCSKASTAAGTRLCFKKATTFAPHLFVDNKGAIFCAKTAEGKKMKHVAIRYMWLRQKVGEGALTVSYVPTDLQVADILTKPPANEAALRTFNEWLFSYCPEEFSGAGA
jgi:transposase InsO family protein